MLTVSKQSAIGSLELVTPATTLPVTVAEMKAHGRHDVIAEGDDFMEALVEMATARASDYTGRAFCTEAWRLVLDDWPRAYSDAWWNGVREGVPAIFEADSVLIRKAPFITVSSVKTIAEDGTETTWASSNYYALKESGFGRLVKRSGAVWPTIASPVRQKGGIEIAFTAGYGDDATNVPAPIRQAIRMMAQHYYENRETQEIPAGAATILSKYRVIR